MFVRVGVPVLMVTCARRRLLGSKEEGRYYVAAVIRGACKRCSKHFEKARCIGSNIGNGYLFHRGPRSVEGGEGGEGGAQSVEDAEMARIDDEDG